MILTKWSFLSFYFFLLVLLEFQALRIGEMRLNLIVSIVFSFIVFAFLFTRTNFKCLFSDSALFTFFLYLCWCTLSFNWSFIGVESVFHTVPIWLLFLCAASFSDLDLEGVIKKWIMLSVFLMAVCWALAIVIPSFAVLPDVVWRLNGLFAHSQRLALFSAACILVSTIYYLNLDSSTSNTKLMSNRLIKIFMFFSFVTLIATQARAFSVAFVLTYGLLLYAHYKSHLKIIYVICAAVFALLVYANIDFIMETFSRGDVSDASLTGRVPTWLFAIELIYDQPWQGYGFGSFFSDLTIEPGRQYVSPHAHNSWINAALETGYIGAFLMSLFLVLVLINAINYQKKTKKLSYSLFVFVFIIFCGLTGVVIGGKVTTLLGFSLLIYAIEMRVLRHVS